MPIIQDSLSTEMKIRITYADTDQMGMVYYANYLCFFEQGRTEWLRDRGLAYIDLEKKGIYLPVIECICKYHSPARYDNLLKIRTSLLNIGHASVEFSYEIVNEEEKLIVTGKTKHPFVNNEFRPIRIPDEIKKIMVD